ncbi:MAG: YddF family protein [Bacteroidetes bacterium]|nr:YddF family protein [Bacteroidota bacterium]
MSTEAYIFSSPTLPNNGIYDYRVVSVLAARDWFRRNAPVCNIGNQDAVDALGLVLGEKLTAKWKRIEMNKGDEALVFRLKLRAESPLLRRPRCDVIVAHSELGLLRKVTL